MPAVAQTSGTQANQSGANPQATTATGCVFRADDGRIQLHTPQGRYNLVASGNADPGAHVGHTVTVTGTLARPIPGAGPGATQELNVSSITPVSQACE